MTRRFGLGFEPKSEISPSTQDARAFFLELLPKLKEEVMLSLFELAHQPFLEFLTDSQDEILSINSNIGSLTKITDTAIRIFISSWSALERQQSSGAVCDALRNWADCWNLTENWCLYHAVSTLREQHLQGLSIDDAWHEAIGFELKLGSVCTQSVFADEFRERGLDKFTFKYEGVEFTMEGPLFKSTAQFKQEVTGMFEAAGGRHVWGAQTALKHRLKEYLRKVNQVAEEKSLTGPPVRSAEDHFEWLIRFQIPLFMKYREIARDCGRHEKTIRKGIEDVAKLIGLELRSSEEDKHPGRPKGAKDKKKRFRASSK